MGGLPMPTNRQKRMISLGLAEVKSATESPLKTRLACTLGIRRILLLQVDLYIGILPPWQTCQNSPIHLR